MNLPIHPAPPATLLAQIQRERARELELLRAFAAELARGN